jgi:hypothetical protein
MRYVLNRILEHWRKFPTLRLMQLIGNALPPKRDSYYVEDKALTEALHIFVLEYEKNTAPGEP